MENTPPSPPLLGNQMFLFPYPLQLIKLQFCKCVKINRNFFKGGFSCFQINFVKMGFKYLCTCLIWIIWKCSNYQGVFGGIEVRHEFGMITILSSRKYYSFWQTQWFAKNNSQQRVPGEKVRFSKLFEILVRKNRWLSLKSHDYLY